MCVCSYVWCSINASLKYLNHKCLNLLGKCVSYVAWVLFGACREENLCWIQGNVFDNRRIWKMIASGYLEVLSFYVCHWNLQYNHQFLVTLLATTNLICICSVTVIIDSNFIHTKDDVTSNYFKCNVVTHQGITCCKSINSFLIPHNLSTQKVISDQNVIQSTFFEGNQKFLVALHQHSAIQQ